MRRDRESSASRRKFLKTAGLSAASLLAAPGPLLAAERSKGANERLGVGFIGVGGRCGEHMSICRNLQKKGEVVRVVPAKNKAAAVTIPWTTAGDTGRLWTNLLECVRTRQRPYSLIDIAVRVQAPLNMGILSHREGKVARFDPQSQSIVLQ